MSENQVSKVIEAKEIMTLLPHRYPFLLVDRVLDYKEGEWLKAIKNINIKNKIFNMYFFMQPPPIPTTVRIVMGGIAVRAEPKQVSGRYRMGAVTQIKDLDSAPNRR